MNGTRRRLRFCCLFFFNDTATTEIYTLSLHDALPISIPKCSARDWGCTPTPSSCTSGWSSEEHTSELQSRRDRVCRLLLEKKKTNPRHEPHHVRDPTEDDGERANTLH